MIHKFAIVPIVGMHTIHGVLGSQGTATRYDVGNVRWCEIDIPRSQMGRRALTYLPVSFPVVGAIAYWLNRSLVAALLWATFVNLGLVPFYFFGELSEDELRDYAYPIASEMGIRDFKVLSPDNFSSFLRSLSSN